MVKGIISQKLTVIYNTNLAKNRTVSEVCHTLTVLCANTVIATPEDTSECGWPFFKVSVQAYFRDIAGSLPHHPNKTSIAIQRAVILLLEGLAFNFSIWEMQ